MNDSQLTYYEVVLDVKNKVSDTSEGNTITISEASGADQAIASDTIDEAREYTMRNLALTNCAIHNHHLILALCGQILITSGCTISHKYRMKLAGSGVNVISFIVSSSAIRNNILTSRPFNMKKDIHCEACCSIGSVSNLTTMFL